MRNDDIGFRMFIGGALLAVALFALWFFTYNIGRLDGEARVIADCARDGFTWSSGDKWGCAKISQIQPPK